MTVEEALITLLAAVAGIMLFLGLAQALEDRPPRRAGQRRRVEKRPEWRSDARPVAAAVSAPLSSAADGLIAARQAPTSAVTPEPGRDLLPALLHPASIERAVAGPDDAIAETPPVRASASALDVAVVESCTSLYLGGKLDDLLAALAPHLSASDTSHDGPPSHALTGLWSLAGLARRDRADEPGARAAFETAVRSLPDPVSEACPPRLAALSVSVARRLLETTDRSPEQDGAEAEARLVAAQLAAFWLRWRLVAAPGDEEATVLLDRASDTLAEGRAAAATALIRGQQFAEALRFIERAVGTGELPAARGEVLLELLALALRREVDQLTAAAVRGSKDEGRAIAGLERAETLVGSMPEGGLPSTQRAAAVRRIWRGYAKLGFRRLRQDQLAAAADALFHALAMREIGRRRQRQVRDAVVRTIEAMVDERAEKVRALVTEGRREAAVEEIAGLEQTIGRARTESVPPDELEPALAKIRQLTRTLEGS